MAVTRSSSAKKVVRKAVAVKVTKSSGRKYVSWDDTCNQLIAFWKKEGHCCPHFSTMLGEWSSKQQQKFQANNPQLSQECIEKLLTIVLSSNENAEEVFELGRPLQQAC